MKGCKRDVGKKSKCGGLIADWRGEITLTEGVSGSERGEDEDDADAGEGNVRTRVREDEDSVGGVVVIIVGRQSEAVAVEGAVHIVVWRKNVEELNKGQVFENIASQEEGTLWKGEKGDESRDPDSGARVKSVGLGDEKAGKLWEGFGRAEGR